MQVWLSGNGERLRLPVIPASYQVTGKQNNTIETVNGLGEIMLKGKRSLFEISFSCFFPKRYDSSYCAYSGFPSPQSCVNMINRIKEAGHVKLIITGVPVSMYVEIEEFTWGESDQTGDIAYTLTMKEDRKPVIPVAVIQTETQAPENITGGRNGTETATPTTYTVKQGDCLSSIARKLTGSSDWHALYEQNKSVIGGNPNLIYAGQVLVVPGGG